MLLGKPIHPPAGEGERAERLLALIDAFGGRHIAVVGDMVADEFVYGQIARVSREAPVLILRHDRTEILPGGGANAVANVRALGATPLPVGVVGRDEAGRQLLRAFRARRIATRAVPAIASYGTPTKTRILAGGVHSTKQQIVRVDREPGVSLNGSAAAALERHALAAVRACDAVLFADYGFGAVSPELVRRIIGRLERTRTRRRPIPVTVDSRYDILRYCGVTAITPNEPEVEAALGRRIGDDWRALAAAGRTLLRRTRAGAVLITRGSKGMVLFQPGLRPIHVPIFGGDQVADVTGAGDTVIATFTLALAAGASFYEAALLANYAGGLVVMKRGTATVTADELRRAVEQDHKAGLRTAD